MSKSLVIVESPAKAKTINRYLGDEYVVRSSIGHVRDLPGKSRSGAKRPAAGKKSAAGDVDPKRLKRRRLYERMGVDPERGWRAQYEMMDDKAKVINELKLLAKKSLKIYLATDPDREGEAIAWHLRELLGGDEGKFQRVIFNEISKDAVSKAFEAPGAIDINRVNAQQARRFLDRVVGFMLSPLLWAKVARNLSAGRVQSVAVRLIVEREREIRGFVPEEFWKLHADVLDRDKTALRLILKKHRGDEFRPNNEKEAMKAVKELEEAEFVVRKRTETRGRTKPAPPLITSTLQQAASARLGFGVRKTMTLAQKLYEAGHITYMRTDSRHLSEQSLDAARDYINKNYGERYLPDKPIRYRNKGGAQEAHEAIRPVTVGAAPDKLPGDVDRDARRLYDLIWRRFIACQMNPSEHLSVALEVEAGVGYEFRANGRVLKFDGFTRALPSLSGDDVLIPDLKQGDMLRLERLEPSQHFTKPPHPRYREASLVKELESLGIGRPSTYASIISTIQERGYVKLQNKCFHAEEIGSIVTDRLNESFKDLMDYDFTASLEKDLDDIADGRREWKEVLDEFYKGFIEKLDEAEREDAGMRSNDPIPVDLKCEQCGRSMQLRTGATGRFLGCSGYNVEDKKQQCKATLNLSKDEATNSGDDEDEEQESRRLRDMRRCSKCNSATDAYLIDWKRRLHVCHNSASCQGIEIEHGEFSIAGVKDGLECDRCQAPMEFRTGRFGKYFGCSNPECKNTRSLLADGTVAPPKKPPLAMPELRCEKVDDHYVLRIGRNGVFLAASQFPKHRETRPPLVAELLAHKDELHEEIRYLCDGPVEDPKGNKAQVRYSRKYGKQYLMSFDEKGNDSGWRARYINGCWQEEVGKPASAGRGSKRAPARRRRSKAPN